MTINLTNVRDCGGSKNYTIEINLTNVGDCGGSKNYTIEISLTNVGNCGRSKNYTIEGSITLHPTASYLSVKKQRFNETYISM